MPGHYKSDPVTATSPRSVVRSIRSSPNRALGVAAGIAIVSGLLIALISPRGPGTPMQAIIALVIALTAGIAGGLIWRSRWVLVLIPTLNLLAFEIVRIGEIGPTVDWPSFSGTFAIISILVGRGAYLLLVTFPIVVGIGWGVSIAHRIDQPTRLAATGMHTFRRIGLGISTIALIGLAIWIALPPTVPAVTDENGNEVIGSISDLVEVEINGNQQWLEIRGASEQLPVMLYISGGPGQSDLSLSRVLLNDLTQDVIIVGWDQRGNGKSYGDWDADKMTLDMAIADTIAVTEYLLNRFDEQKIYVLGESWGSLLGVLAVQQRPDLFHAYIGSGQMVDLRATDTIIYQDLLAYAETTGDSALGRNLSNYGPPPYEDIWAYAFVLGYYDKLTGEYDPPPQYEERADESGVGFMGIMGSEYTLIDKLNVIRGLIDTFHVMYPQLQEIDFRTQATTLDIPVYIFSGSYELNGRLQLLDEWYPMLNAPIKRLIEYENAGHAVVFEHADEFRQILIEEILPSTYVP